MEQTVVYSGQAILRIEEKHRWRYLVVRPCLALENWSNVETDRLDLPEEPWARTVLHHSFYLESQLLGVLHWDWFTWCSWWWRKSQLKNTRNKTYLNQPYELKTVFPICSCMVQLWDWHLNACIFYLYIFFILFSCELLWHWYQCK